jgi:ATP synthase protein I
MNDTNNGLTASGIATKDVFKNMLRWQLIATLVVATIALMLSNVHAGISALVGGMSVVIGAFVASRIAQRNYSDASAVLINMLKAEAVKIVLIALLLLIAFKLYKQLVPVALMAGLAASALFSGAALSKLKN